MAQHRYSIGVWSVVAIVALRVLIGWHFLGAGIEKFDPKFSAAGFLGSANGPLADFYKSMAPQPHDWDRLIVKPMPPLEKYEPEMRFFDKGGNLLEVDDEGKLVGKPHGRGFVPYPTEAYGPWAAQIADDWHATLERFKEIPGLTDEQKQAADDAFLVRYASMVQYIDDSRLGIWEYQEELKRLAELRKERNAGAPPFVKDRVTVMKSEVAAMPRKYVAGVAGEEEVYHLALGNILSDDQRGSAKVSERLASSLNPPERIELINKMVMWVTLGVGACLILGLFTRVASLVGAGFLLSIMSMNPPWVPEVLETVKLIFAYQGIEVIALFLLAAVGAGAWAGLDGVIWGRPVIAVEEQTK